MAAIKESIESTMSRTCQILDTGLAEAAATFPAPPRAQTRFCANKLGKKVFKSDWTSYDHSRFPFTTVWISAIYPGARRERPATTSTSVSTSIPPQYLCSSPSLCSAHSPFPSILHGHSNCNGLAPFPCSTLPGPNTSSSSATYAAVGVVFAHGYTHLSAAALSRFPLASTSTSTSIPSPPPPHPLEKGCDRCSIACGRPTQHAHRRARRPACRLDLVLPRPRHAVLGLLLGRRRAPHERVLRAFVVRLASGGPSVLMSLINFPGIYAAGCLQFSVCDIVELYHESPRLQLFYPALLPGGSLEEVPEVCRARSPLLHAEKIKTPVLVKYFLFLCTDHKTSSYRSRKPTPSWPRSRKRQLACFEHVLGFWIAE
ncbi:hypothetical protein B0H14DRAFT_2637203 [Mycena olivaceomarginata]|nr:hypothetical protein B0H14DRAFT_2637203 [Mycena olivaceomarginata]